MTKKSKKIAVIDFETDPFLYGRLNIKPFAAGFYDGEQILTYWGDDCVERLIEFILDLDEPYLIYAHNGGKFDFHFMLDYFEDKIRVINGRIAEAYIDVHVFRDSFLILPMALKNYAKTEIDYSKFEKHVRHKNKAEIIEYLKDDCKFLYSWIEKFIERFGNKLTLASTSFGLMKKQFDYDIEKTGNAYDKKFRDFYFGGRVECFESGVINKTLEYVDINSAYPYAMLYEHPKGDQVVIKTKLPKKAGGWFAEIDAVNRGCLPFRGEEKIIYYNDHRTRKYFATGWEIYAGLETKTLEIKRIHNVYFHCESRNFREFINFYYEGKKDAKKSGDKDTETFFKLIMNSSYGKFGQNSREFNDFKIMPFGADENEGYTYDCDFGYNELHKKKSKPDENCEFFNVGTAASITGFVRAFLWRAINKCRRVVYCDTDSLLCVGFNGQVSDQLGDWKMEAIVNKAYIGGRKFYLLECAPDAKNPKGSIKKATKGFSATDDEIRACIVYGKPIQYEKEAPAFSLKYGQRKIGRSIKPTKGS